MLDYASPLVLCSFLIVIDWLIAVPRLQDVVLVTPRVDWPTDGMALNTITSKRYLKGTL